MSRIFAKPIFWVIVLAVLLGLFGVGAIVRRGDRAPETVAVARKDLVRSVSVVGQLKARTELDLAFSRSGRVADVRVSAGSEVARGSLLAVLSRSQLEAEAREATAAVEGAKASLDEFLRGTRPEETALGEAKVSAADRTQTDSISSLRIALAASFTSADDAVRNRVDRYFTNPRAANPQFALHVADPNVRDGINSERARIEPVLSKLIKGSDATDIEVLLLDARTARARLAEIRQFLSFMGDVVNGLSPSSNLSDTTIAAARTDVAAARSAIDNAIESISDAENEIESSRSALKVAEQELTLLKAPPLPETRAAKEAELAEAKAREESVRADLADTELRAPFDGIVTEIKIETGEIATAGELAVSMISREKYVIEARVPEADIAFLAPGRRTEVTFDALDGREFEGVVEIIDPAETLIEGVVTYRIEVALTETVPELRPGMTVNLEIEALKREGVLALPLRAVEFRDGHIYVTRLHDKDMERKEITLGIRGSEGDVEVQSGLAEGDLVVVPH